MSIAGWEKKYTEILKKFNFSRKEDTESARILNSILKKRASIKKLEKKIKNQTVFVIGAGSSLVSSLPVLKKYKNITKIVADGATRALIENKIVPNVVVTDLDSDPEFLKKASKNGAIMVVHSHGDNMQKLSLVSEFRNCIGTTEGRPFGHIYNFGGFTDGDRCVFLARYFKAKRIILFGMDFGSRIGKYSKIKVNDRPTKLRKLQHGKKLLEWLATKDNSGLYTTKPIRGFVRIRASDLEKIVPK
jgi:2-amino-4-hydroxy-6-hydroxymethyldihydropteridine diphosphokinase